MADKEWISDGLLEGEDGLKRCWWCVGDAEYMRYHDEEWGKPVYDDIRLFEKVCLEGFQAGLSWLTILRKRDNFRAAFDGFDYSMVALYDNDAIDVLLQNADIIRHRGKIEATINNAQRAIELIEEKGTLSDYFWSYKQPDKTRPTIITQETLHQLTQTDESKALSKDLKKRGWKFVGPTTCYAFMQSIGMVNDHIEGCHARL